MMTSCPVPKSSKTAPDHDTVFFQSLDEVFVQECGVCAGMRCSIFAKHSISNLSHKDAFLPFLSSLNDFSSLLAHPGGNFKQVAMFLLESSGFLHAFMPFHCTCAVFA